MSRPYKDSYSSKHILREFSSSVRSEELSWHRDGADRLIEVISGEGWQLQMENRLPIPFVKGESYFIKKDEWHRLIKGNTTLRIKILENSS